MRKRNLGIIVQDVGETLNTICYTQTLSEAKIYVVVPTLFSASADMVLVHKRRCWGNQAINLQFQKTEALGDFLVFFSDTKDGERNWMKNTYERLENKLER